MNLKIFKHWWAGIVSLALGVALVLVVGWISYFGYREELQVANTNFKVRILKKPTLFLNYSYLFQSTLVGTEDWKDVYEFTSDPHPLTNSSVLVSETAGFVRGNRVILVTTDSGLTWQHFDIASLASIPMERIGCTWIESVHLDENGGGLMHLRGCFKHRPLSTKNYGVSWE